MGILFFLLWIVLNGKVTLEIILFGIGVSAVLYLFICKFMDYSPKRDWIVMKKSGAIIWYVIVLIIEIVKANVLVIKLIVSSKEEVEPFLLRFKTRLKTKTARVILANSITLTPGTITVSLEGEDFIVHCLDKSMSEGIEDSIFVELLEKLEKVGEENEYRASN